MRCCLEHLFRLAEEVDGYLCQGLSITWNLAQFGTGKGLASNMEGKNDRAHRNAYLILRCRSCGKQPLLFHQHAASSSADMPSESFPSKALGQDGCFWMTHSGDQNLHRLTRSTNEKIKHITKPCFSDKHVVRRFQHILCRNVLLQRQAALTRLLHLVSKAAGGLSSSTRRT